MVTTSSGQSVVSGSGLQPKAYVSRGSVTCLCGVNIMAEIVGHASLCLPLGKGSKFKTIHFLQGGKSFSVCNFQRHHHHHHHHISKTKLDCYVTGYGTYWFSNRAFYIIIFFFIVIIIHEVIAVFSNNSHLWWLIMAQSKYNNVFNTHAKLSGTHFFVCVLCTHKKHLCSLCVVILVLRSSLVLKRWGMDERDGGRVKYEELDALGWELWRREKEGGGGGRKHILGVGDGMREVRREMGNMAKTEMREGGGNGGEKPEGDGGGIEWRHRDKMWK